MSNLQMGKPISVAGTNIIPIEKVSVRDYALGRGYWLHGSKEPVAIVVCEAHGVRVFDIKTEPVSLTELVRNVPGLESALAQATLHARDGARRP